MKTVAFHTLGCKVNQYDTEAIATQFIEAGYEIVDFDQPADVFVINTCTVTNMSDRKSRQMIRRASRNNPQAKIVVVGCFAQTAPEEVQAIPGVNLVVGTNDRGQIVQLVEKLDLDEGYSLVGEIFQVDDFEEMSVTSFQGRTRAFLKIQDGCNQFCSYCKVPYARGKSRSRKSENIKEEVNNIVSQGYREIVLTGVHLGGYGSDLQPASSLAKITELISHIPGVQRVRISSVDPNEIDQHLLELLANNPHVCRHLHIPLQSGSDTILEKMRRKYRTTDYLQIVEKARELVPNIALTTDVIVGFPGESDELFQETYDFIKSIGFAKLHVFKYSPRTGTPAASFPEQVSNVDKERRSHQLIQLSDEMAFQFHQQFLGEIVEVLVEGQESDTVTGFTDNYLRVTGSFTKISEELVGQLVKVKINSVDAHQLTGILVEDV
ncbi:MAG: tRNA (N(6)-L-threonylcarbamoyladenosine(37)-C(2))-methylthiotransferase MtaB [Firmicutes bacterium]|nr:tRNA (N(6)-L-threonylcarbamoyladenosine(37)-C(2))-methylthiotransferase MtaB [Bacillota bacterium]